MPWTPTVASRHALELLVDESGLALPITQWPLPRSAVKRALDALPRELPPALDAARERVAAELRAAEGPALSLAVRGRAEALSGFGDEATPGSWLGGRSGTLSTHGLSAQIGVRVDEGTVPSHAEAKLRLDETAIAIEAFGTQLQAWAHRSWWGPGWQSSLLLGNNAPPLYGIGLQRASAGQSDSRWLSWMGPWSYEFFVAADDNTIDSYLVGTRITMRPFSLLEIGLSRTAQWGGQGRDQSVNSFLRMLRSSGVNANGPAEEVEDPANEMAGFDLRLGCGSIFRCAVYAQLIGENSTRNHPSDLLGLYGLESWSADGRHRWFAEFVATICGGGTGYHVKQPCAYRNHAYPDGYTHAGRWMGSAVGADSRVTTVGWLDVERGTLLRLHYGSIGARVGVYAPTDDPVHSGTIRGVGARQSWTWGQTTLGAELDWFRVDAQEGPLQQARLGVTLRMPF